MDLETLQSQCLSCTRCPLHTTRTNVVFGQGVENAEVLFVGEGPGQSEDEQDDCDRLKKAAKFARYSFANCSSSTSICRINEVLNTSPVSVSATATTAFLSLPVLLLYFLNLA